MIEFWWSSGMQKKKIPWVAWEKLCSNKEDGGLGFHDIEQFNQALLCKQAWRIWSRPDSLVSRVLKSRYFRNGSFLDCGIGSRPSYAWRSLLHGRELLTAGLIRDIGNGRDTNVWTEKWIMDRVPKFTRYRQDSVVDLTLTVSDLLSDGTSFWNTRLVRQTFEPHDAEIILKMKTRLSCVDMYRWGFTPNGCYTTQSGYKTLQTLKEISHPTMPTVAPVEKKLWRSIWKIQAPSKLRHFIWKALSGALAVRERLHSRRMIDGPTCILCPSGVETICHMLFTCAAAKEVWDISGIRKPNNGFSMNYVFLNIYHLMFLNPRESNQLCYKSFPWILWHLWKARNVLIFEKTRQTPYVILFAALEEAQTWFDANNVVISPNLPQQNIRVSSVSWFPPPTGYVKCNVGITWDENLLACGAAWIVRDQKGIALLHSRRAFSGVSSQMEAELLGFAWAVESAHSLNLKNVIFESHYLLVKEALLSPPQYPMLGGLISDIFRYLPALGQWSMEYVLTLRNLVAKAIADSVTQEHRFQSYVARGGPRWVTEYHVDGFRFDLASVLCRDTDGSKLDAPPLIMAIATDFVLSRCKLIAEPWDCEGLYLVGKFPNWDRWAEWNGMYRDDVRRFIKGDCGMKKRFSTRISGSSDLFQFYQRKPYHSVNFITAHDGFTLRDLVTYESKRNGANGEKGSDGCNDNHSRNYGFEGETGNPDINSLRTRQMKNFHLALMISQGTPMMLMGDEYGHTRSGNNNSYGHDNALNNFQWKEMIKFRHSHHILKHEDFLSEVTNCYLLVYMCSLNLGATLMCDCFICLKGDVTWHEDQWENHESTFLAFTLHDGVTGQDVYVAFNAHDFWVDTHIPRPPTGKQWFRVADTNLESPDDFVREGVAGLAERYNMAPFSSILLKSM
ncbi:hypothetical protein N665_0424s0035 [Sinapis alba]|nr:hypothetical protein N665_0424s0035 [Sinapis alba]